MRVFFLLVLLAGFGLAGYPWLSSNVLGHPVGVWRVYDAATGYLPATARLDADAAPLGVVVDMTTTGIAELPPGQAILTLTVAAGGKTVLAKALTFADATARETNPQTHEQIFTDVAGVIDPVQTGSYLFTFGKGDAEGVPIKSVNLNLRTEAPAVDRRLQPIGFSLMAVGFIGLVLAFRRGGGPGNPNSQPPPPRWGRRGAQS